MGEALKSTLCFDKGSPLILDVKLFVFGVCVYAVIPPHCRDAAVRHHPVSPEAEGAPEAAAGLQGGQLDEGAGAQLQQQEDPGEGGDDGHAAEHGDGDGQLGAELQLQTGAPLAHHEAAGRLAHVLVEVDAGAGDGVQGAVGGAGQTGLRAEAAAGQAGRQAGQAGRDGGWRYKVSHCVVERLGADGEARWTFFHTALLKEVVAGVALCKTQRKKLKSTAGLTFTSSYESDFPKTGKQESIAPDGQAAHTEHGNTAMKRCVCL